MLRQIQSLVYFSLILLLGIQLTGLSCLDDSVSGARFSSSVPPYTIDSPSTEDPSGDDGCPCHLAYLSSPRHVRDNSSPMVPIISGTLLSRAIEQPFVPFHPPLIL